MSSTPIEPKQFTMTAGQKKFALILMGVGLVMFLIGLVFHFDILPDPHHGGDTHGVEEGGGHGSGHGAMNHDDGSIAQFASHEEGSHDEAEGGHHHKAGPFNMVGGSLLMAGFMFAGLGLFGVFFQAFSAVANAGWHTALKRVPETYFKFLPIAGAILVTVFLVPMLGNMTGNDWHWTHHHWGAIDIMSDPILAGKAILLNYPTILFTVVAFIAIWYVFGMLLRKFSLAEDKEGGLENFKKSLRTSAAFLPIFALTLSFASFIWIMSLEPHWFSTIYGVYCFAAMFVLGMTMTMLIVFHLREKGYMPQVNDEHIHDLGKFMFAFSIFWAYIWVSQYLLIWYANLPEEGAYYILRLDEYGFLFVFNIVLNFLIPFLAFMTRNSKRKGLSIKMIATIMLLGRFLDMFLLVMPGVMGGDYSFWTLIGSLGMVMMVGGAFVYVILNAISKAPTMPKNHPYIEESLHHDVGI